MVTTKFKKNDMIMGYQKSIKYTGFFAGKVLRAIPSPRLLFGNTSYEIELMEELQDDGLSAIWVDEETAMPFNQETYEKALYHWKKFYEYINMSNEEISNLRNLLKEANP